MTFVWVKRTVRLKFTPLEFETFETIQSRKPKIVKIYSVGVWNFSEPLALARSALLKFTPLEFETKRRSKSADSRRGLKFTPLEFETYLIKLKYRRVWD